MYMNMSYIASLQYLTYIIVAKSIPGKISLNSGMVHFGEINQSAPLYSMLHNIRKAAAPKLVPRNCLRYFQATLIMGRGDCYQNLCEVLSKK